MTASLEPEARGGVSGKPRPRSGGAKKIDSDGDGGIDLAIFSGPHAEQRAKWLEQWLRSRERPV